MFKGTKKVVSLALVTVMLLSIFVIIPISASSADGIQVKLDAIKAVYPNSYRYFTKSGNACYDGGGDDCKLQNIPSRGGLPSGAAISSWGCYSCFAFAEYVFGYTFGYNFQDCATSKAPVFGDVIKIVGWNRYDHYGIYLREDANNYYVFDGNADGDCSVQYNHPISKSQHPLQQTYHAPNYDAINGPDFIPPTGTQTISDGEYLIASALDLGKCISIDSNSRSSKANVHLWANVYDSNTCAIVNVKHVGNGYYSLIFKHSGMAMDVNDYGKTNGTNVLQYTSTNNDNQRWVIKESSDGYYFNIISKCNGLYLDAAGGGSGNGTNIQMWEGNNTNSQKWRFIASGVSTGQTIDNGEYYITSALSSSISLDADGTTGENLSTIQIWSNRIKDMDTFNVEYLGNGYYKIYLTGVNRCLDLKYDKPYTGAGIQLYDNYTTNAQEWIIKYAGDGYYFIVSKSSGLVLDSKGGGSANGNPVQGWLNNDTIAQKWKFIPVNANASGTFKNHKYEYYKCKSNFVQAFRHCERLGGHLVTVNSEAENDFIVELTNGQTGRIWIGGTTFGGANWRWVKPEPFSYTNWAPGEPNSDEEICIDMYVSGENTGQWNDGNILYGNVEGFVCEYDDDVNASDYEPEFSDNYKEHRYEFYRNNVDWQSAKKICEKKGGHLVNVEDAAENSFIAGKLSQLGRSEVWIGATDVDFEGQWKDINGNSLTYTNWNGSEPNNDSDFEDYAAITTGGKWYDLKSLNYLNWSIGFVCEYDSLNPEPTISNDSESIPEEDKYTTEGGKEINIKETFTPNDDDIVKSNINLTEFKNLEILGVQKKNTGEKSIRYIVVAKDDILQDADEYGFILAGDTTIENARSRVSGLTYDNSTGYRFNCKGSSNNVSGDYGKFNTDKAYKYVTFGVNRIGDYAVAAKFYVKKGDKIYYATYTNNSGEEFNNYSVNWEKLNK